MKEKSLSSIIGAGLIILGTFHFLGKYHIMRDLDLFNKSKQLETLKQSKEDLRRKIKDYQENLPYLGESLSSKYEDSLRASIEDSIINTVRISRLEKELEDINTISNRPWLYYLKY